MTNHDDEPTTKVVVSTAELYDEYRATRAYDMAAQRLALDAERMRASLDKPKGDDQ